jgi:hypothetical protein
MSIYGGEYIRCTINDRHRFNGFQGVRSSLESMKEIGMIAVDQDGCLLMKESNTL